MSEPRSESRRSTILSLLALTLGLAAWLWPIGIGGRMPVGGDVTQFSIGLMAVLRAALRAGRLPLWNDLWGYGFPGLAESQMGVFYPPHWLLYGFLPLTVAYTASLVLHTLWGAFGAFWAARTLGNSPTGAALSAFAWSTCGFFVIHLPHQWGYTTGSWMPWAWGLAWLVVRDERRRGPTVGLALVLTMQLLPGHFQLAFITQIGIFLIGFWAICEDRGDIARGVRLLSALAIPFFLAAPQVVPTFRLARLASSHRDFEYLSGFAATPIHLVSYVAPGLFQRSPLWRPLVWDPFHSAPEEHLAYIGLVPLFLAILTIGTRWRRDPVTRLLSLLALVSLVLSLGPYVPGFALWSRLPGFSFFRGPARWSLATALALSLLAGRGFDDWRSWARPGRSLARFLGFALVAPGLVILGVELAMASGGTPGWPTMARGFDRALKILPWTADPDFRALSATARRPQTDLRVRAGLARQGLRNVPPGGLSFRRARWSIYFAEGWETAALLAALLALSTCARHRRFFAGGLLVLSALDLWMLGRHRAVDLGPLAPLSTQSPVLARLARGVRTADPARNLPMVAGAASISAYRTLDLPVVPSLTRLALAPLGTPEGDAAILAALRATGAGVRILDPFETAASSRGDRDRPGWSDRVTINDPALAGWLYGEPWVASEGPAATRFTLWSPPLPGSKAWLVPLTPGAVKTILKPWSGDPAEILTALRTASPLVSRSDRPEVVEVEVDARGPGLVLLTQLYDPQWRADWIGPNGARRAAVTPAFALPGQGAWQAVELPEPGRWTLHLEYEGRDVRLGFLIAGVASLFGMLWNFRARTLERRREA